MDETESMINPEDRKPNRPRKKLLYEKVLKQMEFYFGDANLSKDRFLGELLKVDPYVPLEVFLKFNKLSQITKNVEDIAKGLKNSTLLEVSEDNLKVKRKIPLVPYNADERTVYVESIPVTVDMSWLYSVFNQYGPVAYISLPKFKKSKQIKGYAFVEYKSAEDAKKCLEEFTKMGCKLPTSMAPEELSTIKMFSVEDSKEQKTAGEISSMDAEKMETEKVENKELVKKKEPLTSNEENTVKDSEDIIDETEEPLKKKRKKKNRESCEKSKCEDETTKEQTDNEEGYAEPSNKSESTSKNEESETDKDTTENKPDEAKKTNPPRKRKAKERIKAKENASKNQPPEGAAWSLQVLSKQEWKSLRNKYLNIQWKRMKELKTEIWAKRNLAQPEIANTEHYPPSEKHQRTEKNQEENPNPKIKSNCPEQIPGVLVEVNLPEPCIDVRGTKKSVCSNIHVQHVDVKEGQNRMVIRFKSSESALQFTQSGIYEKAHVLCGAEETEQWNNIQSECKRKANGGKPDRGRDRLIAKALGTAAQKDTNNISTTINTPTTINPPTTTTPTAPAQAKHIRFDD